MTSVHTNELMDFFKDPTFAWELLEWEIAVEMNQSLTGEAIARLLELYMKGVEKMNSKLDIRQAYFKNKVTELLMKSSVVKVLNRPPMAKKEKPLVLTTDKKVKKSSKIKQQIHKEKQPEKTANQTLPVHPSNAIAALQRRRQIEMRLAYEKDTSSSENVAKMYNEHIKKQQKFQDTVKNVISSHEKKLQQRIRKRRLKTSTNRSRPQDTSDTYSKEIGEKDNFLKKKMEEAFPQRLQFDSQPKRNKVKRCHSFDGKFRDDGQIEQMLKMARRKTYDPSQLQGLVDFYISKESLQEFKKGLEETK